AAFSPELIYFRLVLRPQNTNLIPSKLLELSTPGHHQYGQHLSQREIHQIFSPSSQTIGSVSEWLIDTGVTHFEINNQSVSFSTTIQNSKKLFPANLSKRSEGFNDETTWRIHNYAVPDRLKTHVNFIQHTHHHEYFPLQHNDKIETIGLHNKTRRSTNTIPQDYIGVCTSKCNSRIVTPACLRQLYSVPETHNRNASRAAFVTFSDLNTFGRLNDLSTFEYRYTPNVEKEGFSVKRFKPKAFGSGGVDDSVQINVDAQYMKAMSAPVLLEGYSVGGNWFDLLEELLSMTDEDLPHTLVASYGGQESLLSREEAVHICDMIEMLGMRGVSVIVSSGLDGVGGSCWELDKNRTRFGAHFPASCPYVTAVGGTIGFDPERAASFSGGGFSEYFNRSLAPWQEKDVSEFLNMNANNLSSFFNRNGRSYPDVSAQTHAFLIIDHGTEYQVNFSSSSCPTFGGAIALVNGARISNGQRPLGFLNPFLYGQGRVGLNDISTGYSVGCNGLERNGRPIVGHIIDGAKWHATNGWDPATGLGTPNVTRLIEAATECM
ncbi:subtilisin-like protein, partial [Zopfia rhizophila CBS 207.26]